MPINFRNPESGQGLWFDTANVAVSMAYDLRNRGVILTLTPQTAGSTSATHWWLDWENKGLWKIKLGSANHEPFSLHARRNFIATSSAHSTVMWGCRDGYIRRLENTSTDDDGSDFDSYIFFGPIGDPSLLSDTVIQELVGVLGKYSGNVLWSLHVGDTPEDAFNAPACEEGIWYAGRNYTQHPRSRGQSHYVKLTGLDDTGWAYEQASVILQRAGRTRP